MVGLMVQSFFNHTPAIPDHDKKAALHSGKARFNRFLDTLATNLRSGQSITNDIPAAPEAAVDPETTGLSQPANAAESNGDSPGRSHSRYAARPSRTKEESARSGENSRTSAGNKAVRQQRFAMESIRV